MRFLTLAACLGLAACGGAAKNEAAEAAETTTTDAVTAEAVDDTKAAEADAMAAADSQLDDLGNSIDDDAPGMGNNKGKAGNAVSNTTKVEVY